MISAFAAFIILLTAPLPLSAKDSLGVYDQWAAFRDAERPRCYAIAKPNGSAASQSFASVATWPKRGIRGQVYIRLASAIAPKTTIRLVIGDRRFDLAASGRNAWAADKAMDAAIIALMRLNSRMTVSAIAENGRRINDRYSLDGVATAMDAAIVGCATAA